MSSIQQKGKQYHKGKIDWENQFVLSTNSFGFAEGFCNSDYDQSSVKNTTPYTQLAIMRRCNIEYAPIKMPNSFIIMFYCIFVDTVTIIRLLQNQKAWRMWTNEAHKYNKKNNTVDFCYNATM